MSKKKRDWTGYIVVIPDQHNLVITGPWKKERPDMWWWKCKDCKQSAGVFSLKQLEALDNKGMISDPDGEKLPAEYSGHPNETSYYSYDDEYAYWGSM